MKNKKFYFTAYGTVFSFSKDNAITMLENVLMTKGNWNLSEGGKQLKRGEVEGDGFYQGGQWKTVLARFPSVVDGCWEHCKEEIESILEDLKQEAKLVHEKNEVHRLFVNGEKTSVRVLNVLGLWKVSGRSGPYFKKKSDAIRQATALYEIRTWLKEAKK
jgi:hypothetical protein